MSTIPLQCTQMITHLKLTAPIFLKRESRIDVGPSRTETFLAVALDGIEIMWDFPEYTGKSHSAPITFFSFNCIRYWGAQKWLQEYFILQKGAWADDWVKNSKQRIQEDTFKGFKWKRRPRREEIVSSWGMYKSS